MLFMKLSVVIPAYNEELRIEPTLRDVSGYLSDSLGQDFEILVVLDGPKDGTPALVKRLAAELPGIRVIENTVNKGKGAVVRQGMLEAQADWVLFMDADNSTNIREIEKCEPLFDQYQVFVASRDLPESEIPVRQAKHKEILGDLGNLWIQIFAVWGVRDTQCGFKVFNKQAVQDIFPKVTLGRWAFDIEVLALAKNRGYAIKEFPVKWTNDDRSHVKLSDYLQVLSDTVKIRWRLWTGFYK